MRIVILGGTGYLGSKIGEKLVKEGHSVLCLVRSRQLDSGTEMLKYCSLDEAFVHLVEYQPDIYINCACCYLKDGKTEKDVLEANFIAPAKILQDCILVGCRKVITMGTALPDDFNMYSFSKKLFVDLGKWYANEYQAEFMNIRLENFYGEKEPQNRFLPNTIKKLLRNEDVLLTDGLQRRDFIYIEDVVDNILKLLNQNISETYVEIPLGTGESPTVREVVEYLHCITQSKSKLLFGAILKRRNEPDTVADKERMIRWGIVTQFGWKEGMEILVREARKQLENEV